MPFENVELIESDQRHEAIPSLRLHLRTFKVFPIRDGAVIGRSAPFNRAMMQQTLRAIRREPFVSIVTRDDVVGTILVRQSILRKISREKIKTIVLKRIKPVMTKTEIFAFRLEIEIALGKGI